MTDLLTTRQVQDLLRVDRTTIYRMVEGGQLPAIRVGKQWRFAQTEVERWLQAGRSTVPGAVSTQGAPLTSAKTPSSSGADLHSLLPLACAQSIQDLFAEMLGVTVVITDMQGHPVTQMSNPCGFFAVLTGGNPDAVRHCVDTWKLMAGAPALEPRFSLNEMGLLCARGLIRAGAELKGMVVIGGIAPEQWPPNAGQLEELSRLFEVEPTKLTDCLEAVFHLDRSAQERALRFVQRIADVFSHMLEDRSQILSRLQPVTALASIER